MARNERDAPDPTEQATDAWLVTLDPPPVPVGHDLATTAMDAAREEPVTRHG